MCIRRETAINSTAILWRIPFYQVPLGKRMKNEKLHTAGLNDTAIPHVKIKITEISLEKKLNTEIPQDPCSPHYIYSQNLPEVTTQNVKI